MKFRGAKLNSVGTFLVGGIIGAGIALLFAPQSGKRTRRDIKHAGRKALKRTEEIGMDLRHSIDNVVDDVAENLKDGLHRGREWKKKTGEGLLHAAESGKKHLQRAVHWN